MKSGDYVKFEMYDSLFRLRIKATGVLLYRLWGKLWRIQPDVNKHLSGGIVQVHENFIDG